ncbi:hypothetical protein [Amycolatopsis thermoflava]|uniref:Uncharacterized protein n=1 Tax=Amycolatopsis thermoflava TaxID=84480 RepID=A0A3N2GML4_9PSEU|nr:hypothetical protein [Amycolatopsis thermoflava]ROS37773.1 hypothetical protein EDD35_0026 [Amycolatopsis thermoflava]
MLSTETATETDPLPTAPCSVVWSQGRPYVLEPGAGTLRWVGTDHLGRPLTLTGDELRRRGWTHRRAG